MSDNESDKEPQSVITENELKREMLTMSNFSSIVPQDNAELREQ